MSQRKKGEQWTITEDLVLEQWYGKITAKEIVQRGLLLNRDSASLQQRAKRLGLRSGLKHTLYKSINLDFFKNHTLESAYWAGFLCADGSLVQDPNKPNTYRLYLAISIKDEEHLKTFQKAMGHDGKLGYMHRRESNINGRIIAAGGKCFF